MYCVFPFPVLFDFPINPLYTGTELVQARGKPVSLGEHIQSRGWVGGAGGSVSNSFLNLPRFNRLFGEGCLCLDLKLYTDGE